MVLKGKIKIIGTLIAMSLILMSVIGASSAAGLLASPGGFTINLNGPTNYTGSLIVENIGSDTLNVTIDTKRLLRDNIHILLEDGGIADWITVNPNNFTLGPKQSKTVSFTVNIPSQVNYNDALGALVIKGLPQSSASSNASVPSLQIKNVPQIVVPIAVGFAGPIIESLQLENSSAPGFLLTYMSGSFVYELKNNGTVYANMTGDVDLQGWFNEKHLNMTGVAYPGDTFTLKTDWTPGILDFGLYNAKTTIHYGRFEQNKTLETESLVFVFPVWLIILIIIGIVIYYVRKKDVKSPIKIKIERK